MQRALMLNLVRGPTKTEGDAFPYFERGDQRIQKLRAKWTPNGMVLCPQMLAKIQC